ncbi:MAG: hypothetical protein FWC04_07000, partial [Chitinispirillia bacterium]|nr:hypothetical protein [Chitinispirillia bacterium]
SGAVLAGAVSNATFVCTISIRLSCKKVFVCHLYSIHYGFAELQEKFKKYFAPRPKSPFLRIQIPKNGNFCGVNSSKSAFWG